MSETRARLAVLEERTGVAGELHDAIAHGVSVMVLQAGAAAQVLATQPEQARQAAYAVQYAGRTVLHELRPFLGVPRSDKDDRLCSPRPSLTELDALIAKVRQAGMSVDVHVYGECAPLPAGIDAGAYRVIQEGLTNALKHAAALLTAVTLDYRPDALTLEIGDRTRTIVSDNTGHGLIGMHSGPQRTQRISTTWPTTTPNVTTFIRDTAQRIFEVW